MPSGSVAFQEVPHPLDIVWELIIKGDMSDIPRFVSDYPELRDDIVNVSLYAGAGGQSEGMRQAGIETVWAGDSWKPALDVHAANHPDAHHELVRFGEGEEGSHEAILQSILDATEGRPYFLHGSPPCQAGSMANPHGQTNDEKLMDQTVWFLDLIDQAKKSGNAPAAWSMENVPAVRKPMEQEGPTPWKKIPSFARRALQNHKTGLKAVDFGSPQVRNRVYMGEGWQAQPTHRGPKGNVSSLYNSISDFLPTLEDEAVGEEAMSSKMEFLDRLLNNGQLGPKQYEKLQQPHINMSGALNPGNKSSSWTDDHRGRAFATHYPLSGQMSSITHNPPVLPYHRYLEPWEVGRLFGMPEDYDWSPAEGYKTSKGAPAIRTIQGNMISPLVARGVGRGLNRNIW